MWVCPNLPSLPAFILLILGLIFLFNSEYFKLLFSLKCFALDLFFSCQVYILTYVDISICILNIYNFSFILPISLSLLDILGDLFSACSLVHTLGGLLNSHFRFFLLTLLVWQCAQTQGILHYSFKVIKKTQLTMSKEWAGGF